jgi:hypothetical protein
MRVPVTVSLRRTRAAVAAGAVAVLLVIALIVIAVTTSTSGPRLCGKQRKPVASGSFLLQNDEWNSTASECISYSPGAPSFSVATTSISMPEGGSPGGYPSVSDGCFYGYCTRGSGLPRPVSSLTPGSLISDWSTSQPGAGRYDVAYDIWYSTSPYTPGHPDGAEMMIWIGHNGSVRPLGAQQGTISVGGQTYLVWYGYGSSNSVPTVSYEATSPVSRVSGLDIAAFTQDAMWRGYVRPNWYLTDVQAGFELWQGGQGLATNSFSVKVR